jgi:hypothetical protein
MNIEKSNISISKAVFAMGWLANLIVVVVGVYWGNKLALAEINHKIEMIDLQYKQADELIKRDIRYNFKNYIGDAMLPAETRVPEER